MPNIENITDKAEIFIIIDCSCTLTGDQIFKFAFAMISQDLN